MEIIEGLLGAMLGMAVFRVSKLIQKRSHRGGVLLMAGALIAAVAAPALAASNSASGWTYQGNPYCDQGNAYVNHTTSGAVTINSSSKPYDWDHNQTGDGCGGAQAYINGQEMRVKQQLAYEYDTVKGPAYAICNTNPPWVYGPAGNGYDAATGYTWNSAPCGNWAYANQATAQVNNGGWLGGVIGTKYE